LGALQAFFVMGYGDMDVCFLPTQGQSLLPLIEPLADQSLD